KAGRCKSKVCALFELAVNDLAGQIAQFLSSLIAGQLGFEATSDSFLNVAGEFRIPKIFVRDSALALQFQKIVRNFGKSLLNQSALAFWSFLVGLPLLDLGADFAHGRLHGSLGLQFGVVVGQFGKNFPTLAAKSSLIEVA